MAHTVSRFSHIWAGHTMRIHTTLHTKQSFQSNKTLRKLCGVLATYQGLFFQKTSKKEFKSDLGGTTERKLYKKT